MLGKWGESGSIEIQFKSSGSRHTSVGQHFKSAREMSFRPIKTPNEPLKAIGLNVQAINDRISDIPESIRSGRYDLITKKLRSGAQLS